MAALFFLRRDARARGVLRRARVLCNRYEVAAPDHVRGLPPFLCRLYCLGKLTRKELEDMVRSEKADHAKTLEDVKRSGEKHAKNLEDMARAHAKTLEDVKRSGEEHAKNLEARNAELQRQLDAHVPPKSRPLPIDDGQIREAEVSMARDFFRSPYQGTGPAMLKEMLENRLQEFEKSLQDLLQDSTRPHFYAKYVALTNSSAMGKSRAVLQLGHEYRVFVFYCSTALPTASTFPPRTPGLADLLERTVTTAGMTLYMLSWLEVLLDFIRKHKQEDGDGCAAQRWMQLQEAAFSINAMEEPAAGILRQVIGVWKKLEQEYKGPSEMVAEERHLQDMLATKIKEVLTELRDEDKKELKLLFVVDEAKGLLGETGLKEKAAAIRPVPFLHFRRAAQVLGDATLLLVMGTSARLGDLAPAGEDDESRRARALLVGLLHPICCFNKLDLLSRDDEAVPDAAQKWLEGPERWTRYGRPLWGLRFEMKGDIQDVLELAQAKLLNLSNVDRELDTTRKGLRVRGFLRANSKLFSPQAALSLLAFTVGIEIVPFHSLAQQVSASHMSVMTLISPDRRHFWTVAPLEPVLSAAAADLFQDPSILKRALEYQLDSMQVGATVLSRGDRTEMLLKGIVTVAMLECQASRIKRGEYLSCVPTTEFLKILLGDECKLPEELAGSFLFFNRILCVDHVPCRKEALEYLKRGVICAGSAENQNPGVDLYMFTWFPRAPAAAGDPAAAAASAAAAGDHVKGPATGPQSFKEEDVSYICVSAKTAEWQEAKKLTSEYVRVRVGGLPYIGLNYRSAPLASGPTPGEAQDGPQNRNPNEYFFRFSGIPKALAGGRFSGCMDALKSFITIDPITMASAEGRQGHSFVDPWSRKNLMREDMRKAVEEDEKDVLSLTREDMRKAVEQDCSVKKGKKKPPVKKL